MSNKRAVEDCRSTATEMGSLSSKGKKVVTESAS